MADNSFGPDRGGRRPGRLRGRDPRRATRRQGGPRRARAPGRHLPQLGLHPDQGAAAHRRGLPRHAARGRLRAHGEGRGLRPEESRAALAQDRRAPERGRQAPAQEEQSHGLRWLGPPRRQGGLGTQGACGQGRQGGRRHHRQARHPGHGRPRAPAPGPGIRRQAGLDLQGGHGSRGLPRVAAGHRLGRQSASSSPASTAPSAPR